MYDHIFYTQVQISRSDIRPHIKWAVSLVILHMVTSIFLQGLCEYIWVNILTLLPQRAYFIDIQTSKELIQMDINKMSINKMSKMFFFESLDYVQVPIYVRALLHYTCVYANVALYVTINRKSGKMSGSEQSKQVYNWRFIACLQQRRGRIGLFNLVIIR